MGLLDTKENWIVRICNKRRVATIDRYFGKNKG
jgi:hypothetical protein